MVSGRPHMAAYRGLQVWCMGQPPPQSAPCCAAGSVSDDCRGSYMLLDQVQVETGEIKKQFCDQAGCVTRDNMRLDSHWSTAQLLTGTTVLSNLMEPPIGPAKVG